MSNTPPDDETDIYRNVNWLAGRLLDPMDGPAILQAARDGNSALIAKHLHVTLAELEAIVNRLSAFGLAHEPFDPPTPGPFEL